MLQEIQDIIIDLFDTGKELGVKGLVLEREFKKVITFKDVFKQFAEQIEQIKKTKEDQQQNELNIVQLDGLAGEENIKNLEKAKLTSIQIKSKTTTLIKEANKIYIQLIKILKSGNYTEEKLNKYKNKLKTQKEIFRNLVQTPQSEKSQKDANEDNPVQQKTSFKTKAIQGDINEFLEKEEKQQDTQNQTDQRSERKKKVRTQLQNQDLNQQDYKHIEQWEQYDKQIGDDLNIIKTDIDDVNKKLQNFDELIETNKNYIQQNAEEMFAVKDVVSMSNDRLKYIVAQFGGSSSIIAELVQAFLLIVLIGLFFGLLIYYLNL